MLEEWITGLGNDGFEVKGGCFSVFFDLGRNCGRLHSRFVAHLAVDGFDFGNAQFPDQPGDFPRRGFAGGVAEVRGIENRSSFADDAEGDGG